MGRTACTEPQCLYKGALYLYLTVELYLYPPMGRTACTEPQCLYKGDLYLLLFFRTTSVRSTVTAFCHKYCLRNARYSISIKPRQKYLVQLPLLLLGHKIWKSTNSHFSHSSHLTLSNIRLLLIQYSRISLQFKYSVPDLSVRSKWKTKSWQQNK